MCHCRLFWLALIPPVTPALCLLCVISFWPLFVFFVSLVPFSCFSGVTHNLDSDAFKYHSDVSFSINETQRWAGSVSFGDLLEVMRTFQLVHNTCALEIIAFWVSRLLWEAVRNWVSSFIARSSLTMGNRNRISVINELRPSEETLK